MPKMTVHGNSVDWAPRYDSCCISMKMFLHLSEIHKRDYKLSFAHIIPKKGYTFL